MSHSIVFTGKIRDGATLEETRRNLAEMFRISDPLILDRVFSGKPAILKKGLDEHEARKQEMILLMAGAVCEIRVAAAPPAPAPTPPAAEPPAPGAPAQRGIAASGTGDAAAPSMPVASAGRPVRMELSSHARSSAPAPAAPPPVLPQPDHGPGLPATATGGESTTDYLPAALRGGLAMAPVMEAQAAYDPARVTAHGRPGEALLDELHAPWDPAFVPDAVRGLSWAGFLAPLLWGSFNGMPLSFLPLVGIRLLRHFVPPWAWMVFYLGFGTFYLIKGRELAWEHKRWRNAEHFIRVQRNWTIACLLVFLLSMYGLFHLMNLATHGPQGAMAQQLARAEIAVAQAATPEAREAAIAERNRLRENVLASIPDPAVRERERQAYAAMDQGEEEERDSQAAQPAPDTPAPPQ